MDIDVKAVLPPDTVTDVCSLVVTLHLTFSWGQRLRMLLPENGYVS